MVDCYPHFNKIPEDVQRLIFEFAFEETRPAASSDKRDHGVALALVSKKVNKWIEPLIYRNIITSRIRGNPIRGAYTKPRDFFNNHVKTLFVDEIGFTEFIEDILSECHTNLVGLAWWPVAHNRGKWASFLLTQSFPSLRKLSIYYGAIFPSNVEASFNEPIFQNLTHLDIGLPASGAHFFPSLIDTTLSKVGSWKNLQCLESLIHLHLDMYLTLTFRTPRVAANFQEMVLDVLPHLPHNVRYLSFLFPYAFLSEVAMLPPDSRQFFDDLIRGKTDPRVLICYRTDRRVDNRSRRMVEAYLSVEGFSEYVLPRNTAQGSKATRIVVPKPNNDFWEEAERMIDRRNKEGSKGSGGAPFCSE